MQRVLDIGCGTGSGLVYLSNRLPNAELVGIDAEAAMVELACERLGSRARIVCTSIESMSAELGTFDLVLSYSNLRLWRDPVLGLGRVARAMNRDGIACINDLHHEQAYPMTDVLAAADPAGRRLLDAQLEAAYERSDVARFLRAAGIRRYELSVGGLAGRPIGDLATATLLRRNRRIRELVMAIWHRGMRSAPSIIELFVYAEERPSEVV